MDIYLKYIKNIQHLKTNKTARHQWLVSIILATWEAKIWRIVVPGQPRE
jgi:hypothetical protein